MVNVSLAMDKKKKKDWKKQDNKMGKNVDKKKTREGKTSTTPTNLTQQPTAAAAAADMI